MKEMFISKCLATLEILNYLILLRVALYGDDLS